MRLVTLPEEPLLFQLIFIFLTGWVFIAVGLASMGTLASTRLKEYNDQG